MFAFWRALFVGGLLTGRDDPGGDSHAGVWPADRWRVDRGRGELPIALIVAVIGLPFILLGAIATAVIAAVFGCVWPRGLCHRIPRGQAGAPRPAPGARGRLDWAAALSGASQACCRWRAAGRPVSARGGSQSWIESCAEFASRPEPSASTTKESMRSERIWYPTDRGTFPYL